MIDILRGVATYSTAIDSLEMSSMGYATDIARGKSFMACPSFAITYDAMSEKSWLNYTILTLIYICLLFKFLV